MKQRGRTSAAALATVTAFPMRMLAAPDDLTAEEADVWARVAATKPGDWWDAASMPLLAQYARSVVQSEVVAGLVRNVLTNLQTDPGDLGRYKELRKIQVALSGEMTMLARSMRLTQQSRYVPDKKTPKTGMDKPWQTHDVLEAG